MPGKKGSTWTGPTKVCPSCHVEKPRAEGFGIGPSAPGGYAYCKECRVQKHLSIPPEEARVTRLDQHLRRKYGITLFDYELYWIKQSGSCLICERRFPLSGKGMDRLHVDHDHATGEVRGLLCYWCNHGVGFAEQVGVARIARYLDAG